MSSTVLVRFTASGDSRMSIRSAEMIYVGGRGGCGDWALLDVDAIGLIDEVQEYAARQGGFVVREACDGSPQCLPVSDQVARRDCGVSGVCMVVHEHIEPLRGAHVEHCVTVLLGRVPASGRTD